MLLILSGVLTTLFPPAEGDICSCGSSQRHTFGYANTYLTIYTAGTFFALMATGMNSTIA